MATQDESSTRRAVVPAAAASAAAAAQPPPPPIVARVLRALRAARSAAARCPSSVWPLLGHDGATRGYGERPMAPLSRAEAAEADEAAAAAIGGEDDDDEEDEEPSASHRALLPKPTQRLRAAVGVILHALEAPPPLGEQQQQLQHQHQQQARRAAARALYAADALSFARGLAAYATPWARDAGERLALGLALWCPSSREELLLLAGGGGGGGGGPATAAAAAPGDARAGPAAIVGGALVSRAPFGSELFRRGVVDACMSLDGCAGDDFARFCGGRPYGRGGGGGGGGGSGAVPPIGCGGGGRGWAPCPLARLHARLVMAPAACKDDDDDDKEELEACRDAFLLCLGRARRSATAAAAKGGGSLAPPLPPGGGGKGALPSDGSWASVADLERLEVVLSGPRGGGPRRQQVEEKKKGEGARKAEAAPPTLPPPPSSAVEAARRAWAARPLRDPLPHEALEQRHQRSDAITKPSRSPSAAPAPPPRLSWRQTSADVDVRLALPLGTEGARDVRVEVLPTRLRVRLSWLPPPGGGEGGEFEEEGWGVALEGELYRRVKATEAVWTVASCGGGGKGVGAEGNSSEAAELQLLLPKDETRRYWKGLFAGEEERGHLQLLREAVDAEETRADAAALDAAAAAGGGGGEGEGGGEGNHGGGGGAAELLRQLRERQELVASGALDLEHGFDDFRLVLSDEGL